MAGSTSRRDRAEPMNVYLLVVLCILTLSSCGDSNIVADGAQFSLRNQENQPVRFPDDFQGKPIVLSFLYTNCPTICVVTTYRMGLLKAELGDRDDVTFVSISLDPRRDTPNVLRDFARLRGIDAKSWQLLTGSMSTVDSLCDAMNIYARRGFIEEDETGTEYYTIDHSDVFFVIDQSGKVQKEYTGTEFDVEDVAVEIDELL